MKLQNIIISLNAALIGLTLAATGARVWRRVFIVRRFNLQDGLITLACLSAVIFSSCQMIATRFGLGLRMVDINMVVWPTLIKILMASNTFYFLCNWAVKHSLLLFYTDLATSTIHFRLIYLMHFIACGFGISSILVDLFECRPIRKNWDKTADGWCANKNAFYYANAGIMMATDCVLYAMPFVFTRRLSLRTRQKWGLRCLFGLGGLVIAASAARVVSTYYFATRPDYPYRIAGVMIWAVIENHLAVVVACAPSVKVIISLAFPRLSSSLSRLFSPFTPSRSHSWRSVRYDVEVAENGSTDQEDGGSSMVCTKSKLEYRSREGQLLSPLTPVFFGRWARSSRRGSETNDGLVHMGQDMHESRLGNSARIQGM